MQKKRNVNRKTIVEPKIENRIKRERLIHLINMQYI